jgi:hypothetical protein
LEQFVELKPVAPMKWEVTVQLNEANLGRLAGGGAQLVSDWDLLQKGVGTPAVLCALLLTVKEKQRLMVDDPADETHNKH